MQHWKVYLKVVKHIGNINSRINRNCYLSDVFSVVMHRLFDRIFHRLQQFEFMRNHLNH
jgi:hypothetical protein